MNTDVESTERRPTDYFHFGLTFLGKIIAIIGVVTTTWETAVFGAVLAAFGLSYFLIES
jgi:hypothetical protein